MREPAQQAKHLPPGKGRVLPGPGGDRYVVKVQSSETAGHMSVHEVIVGPGSGPPLHVHQREDEVFVIMEGQCAFWADGQIIDARPGDTVFAPRKVPHTFKNPGTGVLRMTVMVSPGTLDGFFEGMGAPGADGQPATEEEIVRRIVATAGDYGIELLGPNPL